VEHDLGSLSILVGEAGVSRENHLLAQVTDKLIT